jgi:hypothetical protein
MSPLDGFYDPGGTKDTAHTSRQRALLGRPHAWILASFCYCFLIEGNLIWPDPACRKWVRISVPVLIFKAVNSCQEVIAGKGFVFLFGTLSSTLWWRGLWCFCVQRCVPSVAHVCLWTMFWYQEIRPCRVITIDFGFSWDPRSRRHQKTYSRLIITVELKDHCQHARGQWSFRKSKGSGNTQHGTRVNGLSVQT